MPPPPKAASRAPEPTHKENLALPSPRRRQSTTTRRGANTSSTSNTTTTATLATAAASAVATRTRTKGGAGTAGMAPVPMKRKSLAGLPNGVVSPTAASGSKKGTTAAAAGRRAHTEEPTRASLEASKGSVSLPRLARHRPPPPTTTTAHGKAAQDVSPKVSRKSHARSSEGAGDGDSIGLTPRLRGSKSAPPVGVVSSGSLSLSAGKSAVRTSQDGVVMEVASTELPELAPPSASPSTASLSSPEPAGATPTGVPTKGILQPKKPSGTPSRSSPARGQPTSTAVVATAAVKPKPTAAKTAETEEEDTESDEESTNSSDEDEDSDDDDDDDEESTDSSEEDEEDDDDDDDDDDSETSDEETSMARTEPEETPSESTEAARLLRRVSKKATATKEARVRKMTGISKHRKKLLREARIAVKVSREGDLNVKVTHVCPYHTVFPDFVAELMTRFDFKSTSDFDVFCADTNGERVDIDLDDDFEELLEPYRAYLATLDDAALADTKKRRTVGPPSLAGAPSSSLSTMPTLSTLTPISTTARRGNNPLSDASKPESELADIGLPSILLPEPLESSTQCLIRLYVRESYTYKKQAHQHMLGLSQPSQGDALMSSRTMMSATTASEMGLARTSQSPGALLGLLSDTPDSISLQFAETQRSAFGKTFTFNEREELQWSKLRTLGKGSFGTVYEGMTADGKTMAVKVQEIPQDEDAEESTALQKEINLMRTLKHKNIVAYYGCQTKVQDNGAHEMEIFMELCHGGGLSNLRRKFEKANERFSISLVRAYTRQILEGLQYLHASSVMHRDIKSDNVLISATGEAKLADFGCGKRLATAATVGEAGSTSDLHPTASSSPAATGAHGGAGAGLYQTMVGSPLFMAPEVMLDDGSGYSYSADVWSVGCLVLELLGRPPWRTGNSNNVFQLMYQIAHAKGMPTGVPTNCPAELLDFFGCCFERDAKKRATATALLSHPWITCPDNQLQEVPPEPDA